MFKQFGYIGALIGTSLLASHSALAHDFVFEPVATTLQLAPGTPAGAFFNGFDAPVINESGQVAFRGFLTGLGVTHDNNIGVWSQAASTTGALAYVAREGDPIAGTEGGVVVDILGLPVLNELGQVAITAGLKGEGIGFVNRGGIWIGRGGEAGPLELMVRGGDAAPGQADGVIYQGVGLGTFNNTGQYTFKAVLQGPGVEWWSDNSIWAGTGTPGEVRLLAREYDSFPGSNDLWVYQNVIASPKLTDAGEALIRTEVNSRNFGVRLGAAVLSEVWGETGRPEVVTLSSNQDFAVPGFEAGSTWRVVIDPAINSTGQMAFSATVTLPGIFDEVEAGLFRDLTGSPQGLELMLRAGDPVPGTTLSFRGFDDVVISDAGQIAFAALVDGEGVDGRNNAGLWAEVDSGLAMLARRGDSLPGVEAGLAVDVLGRPLINAKGQVIFTASLVNEPNNNDREAGIWAFDPVLGVMPILRIGDLFDLNPDPEVEDLRTITDWEFNPGTGGEDGFVSSFNDAGEFVLELVFDDYDEAGIFVVTIPESPSSLLGDYNGNGVVDAADYTIWADSFNTTINPFEGADGNGNGTIDAADYTIWADNFGTTAGIGSALTIPEPATLSFVMVGLAWGLKRRRA